MMSDHADSPLKQGLTAATSGPPTPVPATTHSYDSPSRTHTHFPSEGASTSHQQPSVRSKLTTQFLRSPTQQLQYHTPVRLPTDFGLGAQLTPSPPILSPYTDPRAAPAQVSTLPAPVTPSATPPVFQPAVHITMPPVLLPQTSVQRPPTVTLPPQSPPYPNFPETQVIQQPTMNQPAVSPYPTQVYQPSPQVPTSDTVPLPAPQAPMLSFPTPHTMNTMNNPSTAEQTSQGTDYGQIPQLHMSQAAAHHAQIPLYSSATSAWGPTSAAPTSLNVAHAAFNYTSSPHTQAPVYLQPPASVPQVSMYPDAVPQHALLPPSSIQHMLAPLNAPVRATATPSPPPAAYGSFLQTHQVKNVQVFTGNADSKMLIEDWVRDMQYLLEAIELPPHLRFSTVVRHLSGEARKLILNLPPHNQTPEKAFEELRAEYGDTQGSLDPLADFYERGQRPGESACSYAIALEATLRAVEETQRGGKLFPDRDSKLTRQFLRGLNEEEVYMRIAPMKPRLLSFRELQDELRNLAKETKKFQSLNKSKKTYAQVQVASECTLNMKTDKAKHTSEWSELTDLVKKLALCQEEQMAKLTHLESRMAAPFSAPVPPPRARPPPGPTTQTSAVTCYRCGKQGHIARVCRAVFPDPNQIWAQQPQPMTPAEGTTPHPTLPLNG